MPEKNIFCRWEANDDGDHESSCGKVFTFIDGTPKYNGFQYCPFCGEKIQSKDEPRDD